MTTTWDPAAPFRPGTDPADAAEARRLVAAGLVRRLLADVLVSARDPETPELRAAAVALVLRGRPAGEAGGGPPGWAVAYGSALWVHAGPPAGGVAPAEVEVAVPPGRHRPTGRGIRHRQTRLEPADVVRVAGVPVTTPVRTAADVARDQPAAVALPALDRLCAATGIEPAAVLRRLVELPSGRGVVAARRVVAAWAAAR